MYKIFLLALGFYSINCNLLFHFIKKELTSKSVSNELLVFIKQIMKNRAIAQLEDKILLEAFIKKELEQKIVDKNIINFVSKTVKDCTIKCLLDDNCYCYKQVEILPYWLKFHKIDANINEETHKKIFQVFKNEKDKL